MGKVPQPQEEEEQGPITHFHVAVIMLHGLGDTGDGWAEIASDFQPLMPHVKFIFPTAPARKITLNMGMSMNGWYDIASLQDINQREDAEGLQESKRLVVLFWLLLRRFK